MFSSALKSFSSNISSNYSIAPQPTSTAGPWKIFDAKHKKTAKAASVFVFDKKSLEPQGGSIGGRGGAASIKRVHEEVLERLKKEASSLARLRHPNVLELAEPVEDTRGGGLMFATEPVTASLAGLLAEKDEQERSGGVGGRGSRYVVEEADGTGRRRREFEIDELEIQKGLLQVAKGLEFLHQSAGLVHGNLTPEAIFVNAKSDWKISGLAFAGAPSDAGTATAAPIPLSEVLNHDPRLPRSVQLNIDYTSPDFVLDNNVTAAADMFSLGLLIIALYNSPHRSPLDTSGSLSSYKRIFSTSSTVPTQGNNFLSSAPLPTNMTSELLPRLITRRPAQRLSAIDFQQAQYFDNILISTIRFLDALPAKTPNEKIQFMRGLPRIMPQFPKSVLEKKVMPALLEEMKDRELLAPILLNIFAIIKAMPSGKRAFTDKVIPKLREIFLSAAGGKGAAAAERDSGKDAGLMIVLENMDVVSANCSGKEFRDDILPIIALGLGSQTHALVDASLSTLSSVLPVLDYSTIKNELFPVIANVFASTNSLAIKIRGLEAFYTLCGGIEEFEAAIGDGLDGVSITHDTNKTSSSAVLDKFTIQEKVVPLLKGIKTKEPGVMMAALKVFKQVGKVADSEFLAMDVLPIMWSFSLGPLLDLQQFKAYMALIKALSSRIEREQTRKLEELSASNGSATSRAAAKQTGWGAVAVSSTTNDDEVDFANLVSGTKAANGNSDMMNDWGPPPARPTVSQTQSQNSSAFSWSTPSTSNQTVSKPPPQISTLRPQNTTFRTVTPDQSLNTAFAALAPSSPFSQPLQPSRAVSGSIAPATSTSTAAIPPPINWSGASNNSASTWASQRPNNNTIGSTPARPVMQGALSTNAFSIPPPPMSPPASGTPLGGYAGFNSVLPASNNRSVIPSAQSQSPAQVQRQGLDKYESLL
ncbi:hypothetical protein MBLNU459_g1390t1 [Dothideomycetes sp. NU459]